MGLDFNIGFRIFKRIAEEIVQYFAQGVQVRFHRQFFFVVKEVQADAGGFRGFGIIEAESGNEIYDIRPPRIQHVFEFGHAYEGQKFLGELVQIVGAVADYAKVPVVFFGDVFLRGQVVKGSFYQRERSLDLVDHVGKEFHLVPHNRALLLLFKSCHPGVLFMLLPHIDGSREQGHRKQDQQQDYQHPGAALPERRPDRDGKVPVPAEFQHIFSRGETEIRD